MVDVDRTIIRKLQNVIFKRIRTFSYNKILLCVAIIFLTSLVIHQQNQEVIFSNDYDINNYGSNVDLKVPKNRHKDTKDSDLKYILFWNDAYGSRVYDVGFGREHFYNNKCPETRCYTTSNRSLLKSVEDFDAVVIHQRGIEFNDMPKKRLAKQYYVQWVVESAQYLYMDIHKLDGYFNWTMTYKKNSDFYLPYGRLVQIKPHPPLGSPELQKLIEDFGHNNRHLAHNRSQTSAAWFVSHCATQARREKYASEMKKYMSLDVYGKCSSHFHKKSDRKTCTREHEWDCYAMLESNYRFYLSFENSLCEDYVTEKFFNILKYDVIPITFNGAKDFGPPNSYINALQHKSPKALVQYLEELTLDDAKYASYFWWRDYYEVRNRAEDRAQAYCDLCAKLNNPSEPPKTYENMHAWWVEDSKCKKYSPPRNDV